MQNNMTTHRTEILESIIKYQFLLEIQLFLSTFISILSDDTAFSFQLMTWILIVISVFLVSVVLTIVLMSYRNKYCEYNYVKYFYK